MKSILSVYLKENETPSQAAMDNPVQAISSYFTFFLKISYRFNKSDKH